MFSFGIDLDIKILCITLIVLSVSNIFLRIREVLYVIIDNFILIPTLVINSFFYFSIEIICIYFLIRFIFKFFDYMNSKVKPKTLKGIINYKNFFAYPVLALYTIIVFSFLVSSDITLNPIENYVNSYNIRAEVSHDGLIGYVLNSLLFMLIPLIFYFHKNIFIVFHVCFLILCIYSVMPITLYILMMFAMVGFQFIHSYTKISFINISHALLTFVLILAFLDITLLNMVINRFFFTIGINNIFYLDFFTTNNLYLFQNSKLGIFFESNKYLNVPGVLIDNYYYQGSGTNQSSGLFASAFANIGYLGVLVYICIIAIIIRVVEATHDDDMAIRIKLLIGFALINFPLHQLFLTNGLFLYLLFNFLSKNENSAHNRLL